jgi:hypothetical protein
MFRKSDDSGCLNLFGKTATSLSAHFAFASPHCANIRGKNLELNQERVENYFS